MKQTVFNMAQNIEAVDPMVLTLKAAVKDILTKENLMRFEISVIEALTNSVEHAKTDEDNRPVEIHLGLEKNGASVAIFDQDGTPPFDLRAHATDLSSVESTAESGRGLGLILDCANHVEYGDVNGRNRILMSFSNTV